MRKNKRENHLIIGLFVSLVLLFATNITISQAQISITPTPSPTIPLPVLPTPFYYTVVAGDTLETIAFKFGGSVSELLSANTGVNVGNLSTGMLLRIPSSAMLPQTTAATPVPVNQELIVGGAPIAPPTPTPYPDINTFQNTARFTFKDLGQPTFVLHYPSSQDIFFNLPDIWNIQYGLSFVDIHYDLQDYRDGLTLPTLYPYDHRLYGEAPEADVYINGFYAGTFIPERGYDHWTRLYFPAALLDDRQYSINNEYNISIQYFRDNSAFCGYDGTITVRDDSSINLMFATSPTYLSLADFPSPLVFDSFLAETLPIIIPDQFTESDLSAAANIAATIGRKTTANVTLKLITASEVTQQLLATSNVIAIGQPENNTFIKELYNKQLLHTALSIMGVISDPNGTPIAPEDGVLELTRSDINNLYSYLVITGKSEKAIERAVNALVIPPVTMGGLVSIIKLDPYVAVAETTTVDTYRLANLGFRGVVFYGIDTIYNAIASIYIPRNWVIQENGYLAINYDISSNLTIKNSGINVYLNGNLIGSVPLDTTPGEKQAVIPIRADAYRMGYLNSLRFEAILEAPLECNEYDIRAYWLKISNTSFFKIPHQVLKSDQTLPPYIHPFFYLSSSPSVMISLPQNPTNEEMGGMLNVAKIVGTYIKQPYYNYKVSLDPSLDPAMDITTDVIIIGKPSRNPLLTRINDQLPQPFVPGEDNLTLKDKIGSYRIQQNIGIGLIQVMPAPWDPLLGVTIITGTTDQGFTWAVNRLSSPTFTYDFAGDLSFLQDRKVDAFQTTQLIIRPMDVLLSQLTGQQATLVTITPSVTLTAGASGEGLDRYVSTSPKNEGGRSPILTYGMVGLVILALIVFVFAITQAIRGGRRK